MLNNIKNGILNKLTSSFGEDYTFYSDELASDLKKPCFYISLSKSNKKQFLKGRQLHEQSFDIQYFPLNKSNSEYFDVSDKLYNCLKFITVGSDELHGTKLSTQIIDGVLHFYVNYDLFTYSYTDSSDNMLDLSLVENLKV